MSETADILERTRELVARSAYWQAWLGLDPDDDETTVRLPAARAKVFVDLLPDLSPDILPVVVLSDGSFTGRRQAAGGGSFRFNQSCIMEVYGRLTSAVSTPPSVNNSAAHTALVAAVKDYRGRVNAIIADMATLAGSGFHIVYEQVTRQLPPTIVSPDMLEEGSLPFPYIVSAWEWEGMRWGASTV